MSSPLTHPYSFSDASGADDQLVSRDNLRRRMRALRRAVTASQQREVAKQLARWISRTRFLHAGSRVGVYLPRGREADLSLAIDHALVRGCRLYVPHLTHLRRRRMEFVEFNASLQLRENAFGILEPRAPHTARIPVRHLDLILLPLVAVDSRGWRLGSGAGFYDRRLSHLREPRRWRRPKLIGVGYEFQRVHRLEPSRWDVPVEGLITEHGYHPLRPWSV